MTIIAKIRNCERCDPYGSGGMVLRDPEAAGCVYCGYRRYDGKIRLGDRADSRADDPALADLIRNWARDVGLQWEDADIVIGADGDGGAVEVDLDADFAARWKAAFNALTTA